jgi:hypothetical protein
MSFIVMPNSLYSKMEYLLITKGSNKNCSIINKFIRHFIVNWYTIVSSIGERPIEIVF